jgi:flagellar motor switch protein FliN/FliY
VLYNNDDYLYKLNRPLMMAANDDEDDEIFNEDEDLNSDDNGSASADNGDNGDDADNGDIPGAGSDASTPRDSKGVTGSAMGFGAVAFAGVIPLALLVLYMIEGGLSMSALLFMVAFFVGMVLSIWTFVYYRKGGNANFNRFDVHTFFKWPEIAVITVVLLGVSFYNLANLSSGGAISLSSDSTLKATAHEEEEQPQPIFAPKPPEGAISENEEVLYETPEFSPANGKVKKPVVIRPKVVPHNTARVTTQRRVLRTVRPVAHTPAVTARTVVPVVIPVAHNSVKEPVNSTETMAQVPQNTSVKTHEDEEGTSTSTGNSMTGMVDEAVNIATGSANSYTGESTGGVVEKKPVSNKVETTGMVASLFLGGVLCAALGYAFPLAFAGAILGLFRKFNHPFAAKVKELLNEETGEITLETEAQTTLNKILDYVFRFFIGFSVGGTVGFLLGVVITLPLYFIFSGAAETQPLVANFLTSLGVVQNPDLAFATGVIIAGIMVPVVMLVVGKGSPAGISLTEEKIRQVYSIPVTINKVSTDMTTIPEPAIISFDLEDGEESKDGLIVDEFSEDAKESLTHDLLSEFGVDLESVFGMKVALPAKTNGDSKISNFEKQKVTSILENSLGELGNVTVQVSAELGKANIMLTDWLNLSEGMLIELDKPVSEEIDILINEVCKGKGKLTVVDNHLSVRVSKSNFSQSKN